MRPIADIAKDLHDGAVTSRGLAEGALAKIEDPAGEGSRVFIRVFREAALAAADASDTLRAAGLVPSPLAGIPVSIKDLCDVAGVTTYAGSRTRQNAPPATRDAPAATRDLPDPAGGDLPADTVHRAALAAIADRFAVVCRADAIPE